MTAEVRNILQALACDPNVNSNFRLEIDPGHDCEEHPRARSCEDCRKKFCPDHLKEVEACIDLCQACTLKRLKATTAALVSFDADLAYEVLQELSIPLVCQ